MNKKVLKRIGIITISIAAGIYIIFLLLPLLLNPIINGYTPQIENLIHQNTGLISKLENVKLVTTPKLTAGLKVENFSLLTPSNEQILSADDFQVKMSLLPILAGKIRIDAVSLKNADAYIKINKDGSLDLVQYFPEQETQTGKQTESSEDKPVSLTSLPLGMKLSNHLPNISIDKYKIILSDGKNNYTFSGEKTAVTDFILNKSIKITAAGNAVFKDKELFKYNFKVLNKIMPDVELNDLVFNPEDTKQEKKEISEPIDIIGILEGIYDSKLTADVDGDLVIKKDDIKGYTDLTNVSILSLPASNANIKFNGDGITILSNIYTAQNEVSKIEGFIKTGKKPNINMNFSSDAEIANILKIIKEIAVIFDIKDLQTISANGKIDANFSIKSDLKKVESNGHLKIPAAKLYYGLYKIGLDNINTDIKLDNNNININNIGFSVLNQPFKITGTITEKAVCDLHLTADKLELKGLLVALGQAGLLKDNQINSGSISLNADITGSLNNLNPVINLQTNNIYIKNLPSATSVKIPNANIDMSGVSLEGKLTSNEIKILNPAVNINIPNISANINKNEIAINQTPVTIDKINTTISGKISDYLTEKIGLNFTTTGDIKSNLHGNINTRKQTLDLNYVTTEISQIIIPTFDKSKMIFSGNIMITGSLLNPIIKGNINIPSIDIPEIPVSMTNMNIQLAGNFLNGSGNVQKFKSGGIEAENLTSDFSLKGNNFYLNNLKGNSFDGTIGGNIIYNISNAETTIDFKGENMNAQKAALGAIGIKNALTGTLGFDTKLVLTIGEYNEMMKSLKGDLNFNVKNGSFGNIGRLDNLLLASNIITNSILKTTVTTLTNSSKLSDTAKFDYIEGSLNFSGGNANIKQIKSAGQVLAYYITGKYNLLNGTTNINILGRLDSTIVAKLGPIGELSADKLLSYITGLDSLTTSLVKKMTESPKNEKTEEIPALSNGSTSYKDFKVSFNGGIDSRSSVKSFKWLTEVDTSAIETKSLKETVKDIHASVNEDVSNTIKNVKEAVSGSKEQWNTAKEQLKNSAEEFKNLFNFKTNTQNDASAVQQ